MYYAYNICTIVYIEDMYCDSALLYTYCILLYTQVHYKVAGFICGKKPRTGELHGSETSDCGRVLLVKVPIA